MAPGEPRPSPKPQPLGNFPAIFLFTTCTLCVLFILYRRAESLRKIVTSVVKLTTWTREGGIRLSVDEGPPAREFLEDDYDEDNEAVELENGVDDAGEQQGAEGKGTHRGTLGAGTYRSNEPVGQSVHSLV